MPPLPRCNWRGSDAAVRSRYPSDCLRALRMVTAQDVNAADLESARTWSLERGLFALTILLLVMAGLTGGGSRDRGWGDALTQLLAWPVLLLAVWQMTATPAGSRVPRVPVVVATVVPILIASQWILGFTSTPWATERALWAIMPGVAIFLAALALPRARQVRLAAVCIGLAVLSLVLGYLQLGAPQDSLLNPFPEFRPALNGLFANPNHQGTLIAIALVLVLSWIFGLPGRRSDKEGTSRGTAFQVLGIALFCFLLVGLPLTASRAAVIIASAALVAVPVCNGWLTRRLRAPGQRRVGVVAAMAAGILGAVLLAVTANWVKVDVNEESRIAVAKETARQAFDASPSGTGIGSFVPWFEANAPGHLIQGEYFNHAHNEYVQWWLEAGVAGLIWFALLLVGAWWTRPRGSIQGRPDWLWVGSWMAVVVVLCHSAADYPLRTPALMTVAAALAGVAVSATTRRVVERRTRRAE